MCLKTLSSAVFMLFATYLSAQNYPEGFVEEELEHGLFLPGGLLYADSSRMLIWELNGKVWLMEDEVLNPDPVIDISEEVALWGDHGMVGAALHPNFSENGYIYLFYAVDRHYLMHFGTDEYDPEFTEEDSPVTGRLTRYKLSTFDFTFAIPGSRTVLLGEERGDGLPIPTYSHGVGSLVFGEDGSLLASAGDGNTWVGSSGDMGYNGTGPVPPFGLDSLALEDGTLRPDELLGAYRAQYLDGLNGKILRLDPETGEGLPNNPFYDPEAPNSARSKIYALGFRNPYRMTLRKGTGYGGLNDGFPGVIYVSDVGDWVWEEINVVREPGRNFGWPMYQGPVVHPFYYNNTTVNTNAPNPLHGESGCDLPFFNYQQTVLPENEFHDYYYPNPCNTQNEIPTEVATFVHERPVLAYANEVNDNTPYAVYPSFDAEGDETYTAFEDEDSSVEGQNFRGLSTSGGTFLEGELIPEEFRNVFVFADFSGWIRAARFDENDELQSVELWNGDAGRPITVTQNPYDGCVYYSSIFPSFTKKICFGGNRRPVLEVDPEIVYGTSPLEVQFSTEGSYDPEGDPLQFLWEFCDGSTSDEAHPSHTFTSEGNGVESCQVKVAVSDTSGGITERLVWVSLNNTPPSAQISSIEEGELYSINQRTNLNLLAEVEDEEHSPDEMEYKWTLLLHHNTHFHIMSDLDGNDKTLMVNPTGCSPFETYWYEVQLEVTDPGGLQSFDSKMIYPDCDGELEEGLPSESSFLLVPNPVVDVLEVRSDGPIGDDFEYEIYGLDGRLISSGNKSVFNDRRYVLLDVSGFPKGFYVLHMRIDGSWKQDKFLKINR